VQVADRWHLLHNTSSCLRIWHLKMYLQRDMAFEDCFPENIFRSTVLMIISRELKGVL
jgi:hypothetical protein